ncbi:protein YcaR [Salmonella enterica subsp. enterica serovar Newport]|uniref:protein YcaR n=1 Tax=Salmonella enterica TaxID=28901 RepID=UPI002380F314|nr:protein YcaR [Salmonella enterica]WDX99234.1 protein YcaR [Salmonella enterica subsp. enterica serovar Newport]
MDHRLREIIACPVCNGKLWYNQEQQELICKLDNLAFPLRDGIPVLLENEARALTSDESKS